MRESRQNVPTAYPMARTATLRGYAAVTYPVIAAEVTGMGLDRVELSTSRLSGARKGKRNALVNGESAPLTASRPQQPENTTAPQPTSARTRRVPAKADAAESTGSTAPKVRTLRIGFGNTGWAS